MARPGVRTAGRRRYGRLPRIVGGAQHWLDAPNFNVWRFAGDVAADHPKALRALKYGALALALFVGAWWVYQSPLLSVQHVSVDGARTTSPEAIKAVADLKGQSMISPDFAAAEARLRELPSVKSVSISRDLLNGAHIEIVERQPWGLWEAAGQRFVIDSDGVVLDADPPAKALPVILQMDATKPLITGSRVDPEVIALANELLPIADRTVGRGIVGMEYAKVSGLTATFRDNLRVTFGDGTDLEYKIAVLYELLQRALREERMLRSVDLRFGDKVAVVWES
jgi:cell division septal protein FtsQ